MKKPWKRLLSFSLVLLLAAGFVSTAYAAELSGSTDPPETAATKEATTPSETAVTEAEEITEENPLDPETAALLAQIIDEADGAYLSPAYVQAQLAERLGLSTASPQMQSGTLTPVTSKTLNISYGMDYCLFYKSGSTWRHWYKHKGYSETGITYFNMSDGRTGYCIEPFVMDTEKGQPRVPLRWQDIVVKWASEGGIFEPEKQNGISRVLCYGAPNNGKTSDSAKYATAALVWDMACGYRNEDGSLRMGEESPFGQGLQDYDSAAYAEYQSILSKIAKHGKIPSFTTTFASAAPTYTMQKQANGSYRLTLTDTNGVLDCFHYSSSVAGLTFSASGNTLTVTATAEAAAQLTGGVTAKSRGHDVEIDPEVTTVWQSASGSSSQLMATLDLPTDPVPSYFKLRVEAAEGDLEIVKTTDTGENLSGWKFRVTDESGAEITGSPFVTGDDGRISVSKLKPGVYTVEELLEDGSLYTCTSENPQTVTVESGKTATVRFANVLRTGTVTVCKVDTVGNALPGAKFLLEWSADGTSWQPVSPADSGKVQPGSCASPGLSDGCLISGEDGMAVFTGLHPALFYRLTEVAAPPGYLLLTEPVFTGKLPADTLALAYTVHNAPGFTLPNTGSTSLTAVPAIGLVLFAAAGLAGMWLRRKREAA